MDHAEPAGVHRFDILGSNAGFIDVDHIHQNLQVGRAHLVLNLHGLLHALQLGDDGKLQVQSQAELRGLLAEGAVPVHRQTAVLRPDTGKYLGGPQLRSLFKGGPVVAGQILPDAEQLDVEKPHLIVLQSLPDLLHQGGVALQMNLGFALLPHGDGAQADVVIAGLFSRFNLLHRVDPRCSEVGEGKLSGHFHISSCSFSAWGNC